MTEFSAEEGDHAEPMSREESDAHNANAFGIPLEALQNASTKDEHSQIPNPLEA